MLEGCGAYSGAALINIFGPECGAHSGAALVRLPVLV